MHHFHFFVKLGLVLIYILKVYRKKTLFGFTEKKIGSINYLHFAFKMHVSSQVLKDFSAENLETTLKSIIWKC